MKCLVLGSGVIGTSIAYYLSLQGAEVTVVDRLDGPALDTSFANAGQISPGYAAPWAAPGVPLKAIKWLMQDHPPLQIRLDWSLFQLEWMARMVGQCNQRRYAINKARMLRLAEYSRDCLKTLRAQTNIQYEGRQGGTLQIFRSEKQTESIARDTAVLKAAGVPFEVLDRPGILRVEPGLTASIHKVVAALRLPGDETGDCYQFTNALAALARLHGVRFLQGAEIAGFTQGSSGRVTGIRLSSSSGGGAEQSLAADATVVALGAYSRPLLKQLGLRLPVYPVKGYSITADLVDAHKAPTSTVLDETYKTALTRFDQRIRVGGMAEVAGFDRAVRTRRINTLKMVLNDLFPGGGAVETAKGWTGLRPMTPDGTPYVCAAREEGLWMATGHGTLGWTMACGTGRLMADLVLGNRPEVDAKDYALTRH